MAKRLSVAAIERIKAPEQGRVEIGDSGEPGLVLRVSSTGKKSWAKYATIRGSRRRFTIGPYPSIGPGAAREAAREIASQVHQGIDPAEEKRRLEEERSRRKSDTFGSVWQAFYRQHVRGEAHFSDKPGALPKLKTWSEVDSLVQRHALPVWRNKQLSNISRKDIRRVLDRVEADAPRQAEKLFAIIRKLCNWAVEREVIEVSPCAGIRFSRKIVPRNRPLNQSETVSFWRASESIDYPYGPFFKLLLVSGQRRGEVAGMRWSELDLDNAEWVIPASRTKAGRRHILPLSPLAVRIIAELPRFEDCDLVFTTNYRTPISGYSKAKKSLDAHKKIENFRLHDLRETAASTMREHLSISTEVIGQVLNHAPAGVTQRHYASRPSLKDMRKALCRWSQYLERITSAD